MFHKYFYDRNIFHKISQPFRHSQQSPIEVVNKQVGYILNMYMNFMEVKNKKQYNEWTDILTTLRNDLNELRKIKLPKNISEFPKFEYSEIIDNTPKFKKNDIVHIKLDYPKNALGHRQNTAFFRMGDFRYDTIPRKITSVYYMVDAPFFRYAVSGLKNVSFSENQLILADENETEEKYEIKQIIGRRTIKKQIQYLIWFKGDLKKDAIWLSKKQLLEDGLKMYLDLYDENNK